MCVLQFRGEELFCFGVHSTAVLDVDLCRDRYRTLSLRGYCYSLHVLRQTQKDVHLSSTRARECPTSCHPLQSYCSSTTAVNLKKGTVPLLLLLLFHACRLCNAVCVVTRYHSYRRMTPVCAGGDRRWCFPGPYFLSDTVIIHSDLIILLATPRTTAIVGWPFLPIHTHPACCPPLMMIRQQ